MDPQEEFLAGALREGVRIDGREPNQFRTVEVGCLKGGEVEVKFGETRVLCAVSSEVVVPHSHRPQEGFLHFNVEFGPIASAAFQLPTVSCRSNDAAQKLATVLEQLLRASKAVDTESLCIVSGESVWSLRCDLRALNDDGNLTDACALAALAALMRCKRASVAPGQTAAAEGIPLSLHHFPILVTVGYFGPERSPLVDPKLEEEGLLAGKVHVGVNQFDELCCLHKPGGGPVGLENMQHYVRVVTTHAAELRAKLEGMAAA
eukprot:Polyplicarium_translucidae@DN2235_c1_g1_i1.p1